MSTKTRRRRYNVEVSDSELPKEDFYKRVSFHEEKDYRVEFNDCSETTKEGNPFEFELNQRLLREAFKKKVTKIMDNTAVSV